MTIPGVDYSTSRPDPQTLAAKGIQFACRYGGVGTSPKWLTGPEGDKLAAAGVAIVAGVEGQAAGLLQGWDEGKRWAEKADAHFTYLGMPPDRPIYFAVDFDVTAQQWPLVRMALRGAASVIGLNRVGVYGGYQAVQWAHTDRVAKWFWQTYAWSRGQWATFNHLEQYKNGVDIGGADVDLDRALVGDYGQWFPKGSDMDSLTAAQVWDFQISSEAADHSAPARDWLKEAYLLKEQITEAVDTLGAKIDAMQQDLDTLVDPDQTDSVPRLAGKIDDLSLQVEAAEKADPIDAVAVAVALASKPEFIAVLANAISGKLAGLQGEITLSGPIVLTVGQTQSPE